MPKDTRRKPNGLHVSVYSRLIRSPLFANEWMQRILVAAYFAYKRFYEDPFRWLIRHQPELFSGGDILDVGANIGYTSWLFAEAVQRGSRVYSLEPDAVCYRLLVKMLGWKGISSVVTAYQYAAGRQTGTARFWHNANHSADHRVITDEFNQQGSAAFDVAPVPMTSVDDFVRARGLSRLAFVKIDVQGYETEVCDGMQQTLRDFPDAVVCFEYSPDAMAEMGFSPQESIEFFRSRNYSLYIVTRSGLQYIADFCDVHSRALKHGYLDILATRKRLTATEK
jgi:FkbM family methyltransferase